MPNFGKLTRLPFKIAEELHRRLLDEEPPKSIMAWLNAEPEAKKVFARHFGGRPVKAGNLSEYKHGAKYAEWKKRHAALEAERADTKFALDTASEAGLDLGDAADSIFISRALEMQRASAGDPEVFAQLVKSYAGLRKLSISRGTLRARENELEAKLKRMEADLRKMEAQERDRERNTVKNFMKWAGSKEAQAVLASGKPKAVQMDLLHALMFGQKPEAPRA